MGEFPIVEVPVNSGTVPEVPLPVTCAAALIAINARPNPIKLSRIRIVTSFLFSSRFVFSWAARLLWVAKPVLCTKQNTGGIRSAPAIRRGYLTAWWRHEHSRDNNVRGKQILIACL
jgi:hypothetical protein